MKILLLIYTICLTNSKIHYFNQLTQLKQSKLTKLIDKSSIQPNFSLDIYFSAKQNLSNIFHLTHSSTSQNSFTTKKTQTQLILTVFFVSFFLLIIILISVIWCLVQVEIIKCTCYQKFLQNHFIYLNGVKIKFDYDPQRDYCAICLINECDLILECNHYFHKECFKEWMKKTLGCPVCKSKVINDFKIIICMTCKRNCRQIRKQAIFTFNYIEEKCC